MHYPYSVTSNASDNIAVSVKISPKYTSLVLLTRAIVTGGCILAVNFTAMYMQMYMCNTDSDTKPRSQISGVKNAFTTSYSLM